MKILQIINSLGGGGAENLVYNLIRKSDSANLSMDLLILDDSNNVYDNNFKLSMTYVGPRKLKSIKNIKFIREILKTNYYDIVHVHLFPSFYFSALSKKYSLNRNVKFVYTEHSTNNKRRKWYFRLIDNYIYSKYDSIISISDGVKKSLKAWLFPKNYKKVSTISNGIDIDKYKNAKPLDKAEINKNIDNNDILILMTGRFEEPKDQITLIRTMDLLPKNYKLILIGEGSNRSKCEILVDKLGLENRVLFMGYRTDAERINKTVDIIVVSSKWEGFGLVAVEGMAAGKPVIASDVPGLNEIVLDENLLFTVGDHYQLAEKITNIHDYHTGKELQKIKHYDINLMWKSYLENYIKIQAKN